MNKFQLDAPFKVLLAVDGSAHSAVAINLVIELTWPTGTGVQVMTVIPDRWSMLGLSLEAQQVVDETLEGMRRLDRAAAERLVTRTVEDLHSRNLEAQAEVKEGRPSEVLLKCAADWQADLIVIGAKGLSAPSEFRLGSTAHKLTQYAECSVLVTRPPERRQILNIVLAADGSPEARRAANLLCNLALPAWTEITVVSVAEMSVGIPSGDGNVEHRRPTTDVPDIVRQVLLDGAESRVTDVLENLRGCHTPVRSAIRCGNVAQEIITAAEEQDADVIVIGARGQTRGEAWGLGSVAQKVVKYAPCSVLVVR
jgi:nucleotide-binding universal stress UspA family protein